MVEAFLSTMAFAGFDTVKRNRKRAMSSRRGLLERVEGHGGDDH
jgi:hypothetical protein